MAALNSTDAFSNVTYILKSRCFDEIPFSPIGSILFAIVFALIALAALIGNAIVIVVMVWGEESSKRRNIRIYLLNLAICDILLTVFMPFNYSIEVLTYWIFPEWTCGVPHYAQKFIVFNISAILTIIGFERLVVTVYPFSGMCRWLKSHSLYLTGSVWITGAIYGYVVFERQKIYQFRANNITYTGCFPDPEHITVQYYFALNFVVSFFIPMVMLIISYASMMRKLKKRSKTSEYQVTYSVASDSVTISRKLSHKSKNEHRRLSQIDCELRRTTTSAKNNTQNILFLVVLLYCLCWAPKKLTQMLTRFEILRECLKEDYYRSVYISIGSYLLAMANSFANPILYSFMCHKFRKDFGKIKDSVGKRFGLIKDEM